MEISRILIMFPLLVFLSYITYNFINFIPPKFKFDFPSDFITEAGPTPIFENAIEVLSRSITYITTTGNNKTEFDGMKQHLKDSFPLLHQKLKLVEFELGIIYVWDGSDQKLSNSPIVLMSHMDTVPVPKDNLHNWNYPPYSGKVKDGFLYGRGTLDTKSTLVGSMNAVEELLKEGFTPKRSIYLCYGFDEEIVDEEYGAKNISNYLLKKGITPFLILDEGGYVMKNSMNDVGIRGNIAKIGIAEKVFLVLNLSVSCDGGHGSLPDMKKTCIYQISKAIQKLIDNPMKSHVRDNVVQTFIDYVYSHSSPFYRLIFSNVKWFPFLGELMLSNNRKTNAIIRTTIAPTIIRSGFHHNVLPKSAWTVLNVRMHPLDNLKSVLEHFRKTIKNERVHIYVMKNCGSKQIADHKTVQFEIIAKSIQSVFDVEIFTPALLPFTTDLKHYRKLSKFCFNFWPFMLDQNSNDMSRIHGTNERISTKNYMKMIQFFIVLIKNLDLFNEQI